MANLQHLGIYEVTKDKVKYDALIMECTVDEGKRWLILPVEIKKTQNKNELDEYNIKYCNNSNDPSETCFVAEFASLDITEINKECQITIPSVLKEKNQINNMYEISNRVKKIEFVDLKKDNDSRILYKKIDFTDLNNHSLSRKTVDIIFQEIEPNTKNVKRNLAVTNNEVSTTYEKDASEVSSREETQVSHETLPSLNQHTLETRPNVALLDKNQNLQKENKDLKEENKKIIAERDEFSSLLEAKKQKSQELEEKNKNLSSQFKNAQGIINSLNETNSKNEKKMKNLKEENITLTKLNAKIKKDNQWKQEFKDKIIALGNEFNHLLTTNIKNTKTNSERQESVKETLKYKIIKFLTFGIWESKEIKNLKEEQKNKETELNQNIEKIKTDIKKIEQSINNFDFFNKRHVQQNIGNFEKNKSTQNLQNLSNLNDSWKETSNSSRKRSNSF